MHSKKEISGSTKRLERRPLWIFLGIMLIWACLEGWLYLRSRSSDADDYAEMAQGAIAEGFESESESESESEEVDDEAFDPEGRNVPGEESESEAEAKAAHPATSPMGAMYDWAMQPLKPKGQPLDRNTDNLPVPPDPTTRHPSFSPRPQPLDENPGNHM